MFIYVYFISFGVKIPVLVFGEKILNLVISTEISAKIPILYEVVNKLQ